MRGSERRREGAAHAADHYRRVYGIGVLITPNSRSYPRRRSFPSCADYKRAENFGRAVPTLLRRARSRDVIRDDFSRSTYRRGAHLMFIYSRFLHMRSFA